MKLKSKIRIFESTIIPVMAYGAQTWATTNKQIQKLQTTQNSMLRYILGIRTIDKVKIQKIFQKTKAKKVWVVAKTLKLRFAGHVIRDSSKKWSHIMTKWVPHIGKRSRGRPVTRWSDELIKTVGKQWTTKAKMRQNWKGLIDT